MKNEKIITIPEPIGIPMKQRVMPPINYRQRTMRKIGVSIWKSIAVYTLFIITQAMAVGKCPGIDRYVENMKNDNKNIITPQARYDRLKALITDGQGHVLGVHKLYDNALFRDLQSFLTSTEPFPIPEVNSNNALEMYLDKPRGTINEWSRGGKTISYDGQLRLNYIVREHAAAIKNLGGERFLPEEVAEGAAAAPVEMPSAAAVEPTSIRASVAVDKRPRVEPSEEDAEDTLPLKKRRKKMEDWYKS